VAIWRASTPLRMNMATARKIAGSTVPITRNWSSSSSTMRAESWSRRATAPNEP
jgi:hypothetical protein